MLGCKPSSIVIASRPRLSVHDGTTVSDITKYRSMVGGLQYLILIRPGIAFAVNQVCQFLQNLRTTNLQAVKRIFWYIKHTIDQGLIFNHSHNKKEYILTRIMLVTQMIIAPHLERVSFFSLIS